MEEKKDEAANKTKDGAAENQPTETPQTEKQDWRKATNVLKPRGIDSHLVVYLEDLHMTWVDETRD